MQIQDSTQKFSDRAADYHRYRPGYPNDVFEYLNAQYDWQAPPVVADIGAGTGLSSELFLKNGCTVFAIEPNEDMRNVARAQYGKFEEFQAIDGTASATKLDSNSVDLIFCAQAIHWFEPVATKKEFERILKPTGHIVVAWNYRENTSPFQKSYEEMLHARLTEYGQYGHRGLNKEVLQPFFHPRKISSLVFQHQQKFDLDSLKGRLLSASYCPKSGKIYEAIMKDTEALFNQFQNQGKVTFDYTTNVFHTTN